jgi:hypothetical protein
VPALVDVGEVADHVTHQRTPSENLHPLKELLLLAHHVLGRDVVPLRLHLALQLVREHAEVTDFMTNFVEQLVKGPQRMQALALGGVNTVNTNTLNRNHAVMKSLAHGNHMVLANWSERGSISLTTLVKRARVLVVRRCVGGRHAVEGTMFWL